MHGENRQIIEGVIWKQLLLFFFPIMLGMFFQQMYNTVDVIVVGHVLGTTALAAVGGPTSYLINLLLNLFVGICSGSTVVIAQYFGAGDKERTADAVHSAMLLSLWAGVGFSVFGVAIAKPVLVWMGTPDEVMAHAVSYLRIYYAGLIFSFMYNMGSSVLRAKGDSRRPFYLLVVATFVNLFCNLLFIVKFGWGVAGVAWASTFSQMVSSAGVWYLLVRETDEFHLSFRRLWVVHGSMIRAILRIGVPTGVQGQLFSFSNIVIQTTVNTFGVATIAAWAAFARIDWVYWMVLNALGVALSTFAGQNFGARQYDRVKRSMVVIMWLSIADSLLCSFVFLTFGPQLLGFFTSDPEVIEVGMRIVRLLGPWYILYFPITALAGGMRGCGDPLPPTVVVAFGICVFRLLWMWFVVPMNRTMWMVWVNYPISWGLTAVLILAYHFKSNWLERCKVRAGHVTRAEV